MREGIETFKIDAKLISLSLIDPSVWSDYLRTYIKKNFPHALFMTYSIMVFPRQGEELKYKIFLNTLAGLYAKCNTKVNLSVIQNILSSHTHVPVKILLTKKTAVANTMNVAIMRFGNDRLALRTNKNSELFVSYFRTFFRSSLVRINPDKTLIILEFKEVSQIERFQSMLRRKIFIGSFVVSFQHNTQDVQRFFDALKKVLTSHHNETSEEKEVLLSPLAQYLAVLEANEKESFESIRKRYIKLAKEYHPDRVHSDGEEKIRLYTQKFQQIQEAFNVIKEHYKVAS